MLSAIKNLFESHVNFRFDVIVEGVIVAAFTECTLPTLQVETMDIKEGGQNTYTHKLPVRVNAGSITLKHGLSRRTELLSWYLQVLEGDIEEATRQVTVVMYDVMHIPLAIWNFRNAYPVKWTGPTLKSDGSEIAIESLELTYHSFEGGGILS